MLQLPGGLSISLTRLVMGFAIVLVAMWAWGALKKLVQRSADKSGGKKVLSLCMNILRVIVFVWAACGVCDVWFNVNLASILETLGIMGIALTLGAQQTISNLIGGVIVSLSTLMNGGDWVLVGRYNEGKVIDTNWRCTILQDVDGVRHLVPNSVMLTSVVKVLNPYQTVTLSFDLKASVADVEGLLRECEQLVFDFQKQQGTDYQNVRPTAMVKSVSFGAMQSQVEFYATREISSSALQRDVFPVLLAYLKERDALALAS